MPAARKCSAVYSPDSPKKELLQDLVTTILTDVVPNCSLASPGETV